ncbi:MAG: GIY-YIG nuclease family protein [Candidatus Brocadiia bacterium]
MWYVYIVRCVDDTLYTGITNNVSKRVATHNAGKGARYTRSRRPVKLVYKKSFPDKSTAFKRERAVKQLTRKNKELLIKRKRQSG